MKKEKKKMKKGTKITLIILFSIFGLIIAFLLFAFINHLIRNKVVVAEKIDNPTGYIVASGRGLYDKDGNEIILRGTNAGGLFCTEGWLEPYYVPLEYKKDKGWYDASNKGLSDENALSEEQFRQALKENTSLGISTDEEIAELMDAFYTTWFTKDDMKNISDLGLNCLRVPFYWKNFIDYNESTDTYTLITDNTKNGIKYFDNLLSWAAEYNVYIILDLHGCPESQNGYEHGGSIDFDKFNEGSIRFWTDSKAVEAVCQLWEHIATYYSDSTKETLSKQIAAFDIMNEPRSTAFKTDKTCHEIFDKVYDRIRAVDTNHVIMMEGCWDFSTLPNPEDYNWENVCYEYHWYNWYTKFLPYELFYWYQDLSDIFRHYDVPVFIGEFTFFEDEAAWLKGLNLFEDRHYSWACWTYKKNVDGSYNDSWGLYNFDTTGIRIDITDTSLRKETLKTKLGQFVTSSSNCKQSDTCKYITKFIESRK